MVFLISRYQESYFDYFSNFDLVFSGLHSYRKTITRRKFKSFNSVVEILQGIPGYSLRNVDSSLNEAKFYKYSTISQHISIIKITYLEDKGFAKLSIISKSACAFPVWVPFGFMVNLVTVLLPYPDFGCNQNYVNEIFHFLEQKKEWGPKSISDDGNSQIDRNLFFVVFIIAPVMFMLLLLFICEPEVK